MKKKSQDDVFVQKTPAEVPASLSDLFVYSFWQSASVNNMAFRIESVQIYRKELFCGPISHDCSSQSSVNKMTPGVEMVTGLLHTFTNVKNSQRRGAVGTYWCPPPSNPEGGRLTRSTWSRLLNVLQKHWRSGGGGKGAVDPGV